MLILGESCELTFIRNDRREGREELCRRRAIRDAMVKRQAQHTRAARHDRVAVNNGFFLNPPNAENSSLRWV